MHVVLFVFSLHVAFKPHNNLSSNQTFTSSFQQNKILILPRVIGNSSI